MNIETASANVRTMDGDVKAAAVHYKKTEESIEAEVLPERDSVADSASFGTMDE